jgi:2-polyprenyl-3-methyl-5-hydroxy-6-metoxy-1,4-benzoquinol methylase
MDDEIRAYYERGMELDRVTHGYSRIEFIRTKEVLLRFLPPPPARVLDVGGGPGAYADWLAEQGYEVRLVDATPLHVQQATERARGRFSAVEGVARSLEEPNDSYDVVLLLGPIYHLTERDDRVAALGEGHRVLSPGGLLAAAAISRFASLLDGLYGGYLSERAFWPIVARDLEDGQHRSGGEDPAPAFTTAYFHRPEELASEVEQAGFALEGLFGVEGPGWLLVDRTDEQTQENILRVARAVEQEPTVIGTSAHLLAIGRKP